MSTQGNVQRREIDLFETRAINCNPSETKQTRSRSIEKQFQIRYIFTSVILAIWLAVGNILNDSITQAFR